MLLQLVVPDGAVLFTSRPVCSLIIYGTVHIRLVKDVARVFLVVLSLLLLGGYEYAVRGWMVQGPAILDTCRTLERQTNRGSPLAYDPVEHLSTTANYCLEHHNTSTSAGVGDTSRLGFHLQ